MGQAGRCSALGKFRDMSTVQTESGAYERPVAKSGQVANGPRTAWVLSDGKHGHVMPMLGVVEALDGVPFEIRQLRPWSFLNYMPHSFGMRDPRDWLHDANGPLKPPFPDLCIASGRRTVPYLRRLKRISPDTFCVYFMDPRTRRSGADLIVTPRHDRLSGTNVVKVSMFPHRFSPKRLEETRRDVPPGLMALTQPRVAVLIGGESRHHRFSPGDIEQFIGGLRELVAAGAGLMMTLSRRTPAELELAVRTLADSSKAYLWDGTGENPMLYLLALADAVVVTADSINMMGEAAATGAPIHVFKPSGGHPKFDHFLSDLSRIATVRPFPGPIGGKPYAPVDSTPLVAAIILQRYQDSRALRGLPR